MHDIQHIYMHKVIGLAIMNVAGGARYKYILILSMWVCGCVLYNKCYFRQHLTGEANSWRKKERK